MNFEKIKIHYVIALILLMTIPALTTGVQHTNAAVTEWDLFLHVMVSPNPVGLNQNVLVTFQPDKTSPIATVRANNWQGFTVKITKPDGTTETKGPYEGYSTGGAWFSYIPTTIGKYTFQASFPGQWVNGSYTGVGSPGGNWVNQTGQPLISENRWYKPVLSGIAELTVQQEQILGYPDVPLPTDYWTRPIYGENKGWWQVSGNWLMQGYDFTRRSYTALSATSAFAPYTSAPNSAHVLWKRPCGFWRHCWRRIW
jgi:hypothetical protein